MHDPEWRPVPETAAADPARLSKDPVGFIADGVRGGGVVVITGAGISTGSGIPDYRSASSPVRTPMTVQRFLGSHARRQRYWAGSVVGARAFHGAAPNRAHLVLAELERRGLVDRVITQNVDRLHQRAGSHRVIELHGAPDIVACTVCGAELSREAMSDRILALNPWLADATAEQAPDGDALVHGYEGLVVPACERCGGTLKPRVVWFGELVPAEVTAAATEALERARFVLVIGSTLMVGSAMRLVNIAERRGVPIAIINRGLTKGDRKAAAKLDDDAAAALERVLERL